MRTAAPLQVTNLVKSIAAFFFLSSIAWFASSYFILGDLLISWLIFIANVLIGGLVGWWWYRRHYHAVFRYDDRGFELKRGAGKTRQKNWQDFTRVSLIHEGYGRFSVRLYQADGEYLDIPASDLKLPASDFRFEVIELVKPGPAAGTTNS